MAAEAFEEDTVPDYTDFQADGQYSWVKAPRYDGKAMEVGPLSAVLVGYASGDPLTVKWTDRAIALVEQLSGKKVDGRSDLFSLGVMLYQLLAGQLPFQGDSMATLMFKIANEPHPDLTGTRPDLPPCLNAIINKALAKSANDRYSRGAQLVKDLRACASQLAA